MRVAASRRGGEFLIRNRHDMTVADIGPAGWNWRNLTELYAGQVRESGMDDRPPADLVARHRMEIPPAQPSSPPVPTLLIVDDERSVRETLRLLLERRGYRVLVAESGPSGIALAASERVDGAMVDVHMLGMDGVVVCRELRAQAAAAGRDLPVWLMSGARSSDVIKAGTEAGAAAVLGKPFNLAQLFAMLGERFQPAASAPVVAPPA